MALDILSIPCMSADVERLGPGLLEALECLKSWQKIKAFNILESLVTGGEWQQGVAPARLHKEYTLYT